MGLIKKIYEEIFYSEYGKLLASTLMLTLIFVIVFFYESKISQFLAFGGLVSLPYIFEFSILVMALIIVNVCIRALNTTRRIRMVIYTVFFSLGIGLRFISFTSIHWFTNNLSHDGLTVVSSMGSLIITIGIFIGSLVPVDKKLKTVRFHSLRYFVFVIWLMIVITLLRMNSGASYFDLSRISIKSYTTIEYLNAVLLIVSFAISYRVYNLKKNKYLLFFMNGVIILILAQVIKLSYIDYAYIYHFIYNMYVLIALLYIYYAIHGYNIIGPIEVLMNEEKQIKLYAENLEVIVERRTTEMKSNNQRLIQEIEYAKSIQQSLLPARKVNFNKVTFISEYYPCERLSGDFFDIYRLDENNIGMYVLDVSGHGVSAALMTMFCNNYIKSSEKLIMKYRGLKPHRNLKHFYEEFNKMKFPDEMYMVMFFASYNIETGVLTYASGGINCFPLLMRKDGTKEYLDKSQGFPICKMSSFFTPSYTSETTVLNKGDRVIFYTDGLVDNVKNDTISVELLEEVMYESRNLSLKKLNTKLKSHIHVEDGTGEDDITYFIMEI